MLRVPPRCTLTDTHYPPTTLFRSRYRGRVCGIGEQECAHVLSGRLRQRHQRRAGAARGGFDRADPDRDRSARDRGAEPEEAAALEIADRLGLAAFHAQQIGGARHRSEEHTSELESLMRISYAVFCLKKKKTPHNTTANNANNR